MFHKHQKHLGGRVTKWKGQVASIAPALLLGSVSVVALSSPGISATYGDVDISIAANQPVTESPVVDAIIDINVADYTSTLTADGALTGVGNGSAIDFQGDLSGTATVNGDISMSATTSAFGIYARGNVTGTLTNTGAITVDVSNSSSSSAAATGIRAADVSGSLNNSGSVTVSSYATSISASATGVRVNAVSTSGNLTNSGNIFVTAMASSYANALGLGSTTVDGTLANSGDISVGALASSSSAYAGGISATSVGANGSLTNSGNLLVGASGYSAYARGINVNSDIQGKLSNTGDILTVALASSSASAIGVNLNNIVQGGSASNSGEILVGALGSYATAQGIHANDVDGTLTNSGNITVGAASTTSSASAMGLVVDQVGASSGNGTVTNTGDITILVGGSGYAYGRALSVRDVNGTSKVTNSGNISMAVTGTNSGYATGIGSGPLRDNASLSNTGDISIVGVALANLSTCTSPFPWVCGSGYVGGSGIYIQGDYNFTTFKSTSVAAGASFSNTGDISLSFAATGSASASAWGMYMSDVEGSFTNSGNITLSLSVESGSAEGTGLSIGSVGAAGTFNNSGNITIAASAITGSATATAISMNNVDTGGSFSNSGDISITVASVSSAANGTGINASTVDQSATFVNSGNITIVSTASYSADARGLDFSNISGTVTNTGNMTLTANAQHSSASATGINFSNVLSTGSLNNSGNLTLSATSVSSSAVAEGYSGGIVDGTLTNSGNLTLTVNGGGSARAYGMVFNTVGGTLNSSGDISVTANGGSTATNIDARGIHINTLNGTLNVTGDISVAGNGTNRAIQLNGGSGTLNIETSATIDGTIQVADHDVNMTHVGEAAVYTFEDTNTAAGTFTTNTSNSDWVWVSTAAGTSAPIYAAVNTTEFSSGTGTSQIVGLIGDTLDNELVNLSNGETTRLDLTASAQRIEGYASASLASFENTTADISLSMVQGGSMMTTQAGHRFGLGLSLINYDGRDGTTTLDANGAAVNATYLASLGGLDLGFGLSYGTIKTDGARTVGGSPDAISSFDSDFATASISARRVVHMGDKGSVTGFGSALFGQQNVDGYTETGSTANATVAAQTVNFQQYSLGAEYSEPTEHGKFTAFVAAVHSSASNPGGFQIDVLGTGLTGSATSSQDTYAMMGFGIEHSVANGGLLSLDASTTLGGATAQQTLSAKYTFEF